MRAIPLSKTGESEDGFTLVEVLVALVILGVSFAALFSSFSASLDRARQTANASAALLQAQSLMDRLGFELPLEAGNQGGVTEDGQFRWTIEMSAFGSGELGSASPVPAFDAVVTVKWGDRPGEAITLRSLKL